MQADNYYQNPYILIYTHKAHSLIIDKRFKDDTRTHKAFGLRTFITLSRMVCKSSEQDNPYADLNLIELDRRIQNTCALIHKANEGLNQCHTENSLGKLAKSAIDLYPPLLTQNKTHYLIEPSPLIIHANHLYGAVGVILLSLYDHLVCRLINYKELKLINYEIFEQSSHSIYSALRGVFATPSAYQDLKVNRDDIYHKTANGQSAILLSGPVIDDVMAKRLCPKLASSEYTINQLHHLLLNQ